MRQNKKIIACLLAVLLFLQSFGFYYPIKASETANIIFAFIQDSNTPSFDSVTPILKDYGFYNFEELMAIPEGSTTRYLYSGSYYGTDFNTDLTQLNDLSYVGNASRDESLSIDSSADYNDANLSSQWHLNNIGAFDAFDSLANESLPGKDIVIAVIDTGINYTHDDLKNSLWINETEKNGIPGVDDDGNGYKDDIYGINLIKTTTQIPDDDNGHGTHVSGIIASTANNSLGGMGISYASKIMSIKAGDSSGDFSVSNVIKALGYATANGADIINMSLGSEDLETNTLLKYAIGSAATSCLLVAAAGNGDSNNIGLPTTSSKAANSVNVYPAAFKDVLGVMASNNNNILTDFSNFDYLPDDGVDYEIAAPGSQIYSTKITNTFGLMNGTSMAAPIVSAAAAVLKKHLLASYPNSSAITNELLKAQLIRSTSQRATKTYNNTVLTYPKLNLLQAVTTKPKPEISIASVLLYNSSGVLVTDTTALLPNETYYMKINLKNEWANASDIQVSLSCESTYASALTLYNQSDVISSLDTYKSATVGNSTDAQIGFTLNSSLPEDTNVPLTLTIAYSNKFDSSDTTTYITTGSILLNNADQDEENPVEVLYPIRSLSITPSNITIPLNTTKTLTVTYSPLNTTDSLDFIWASTNPAVATVDSTGLVTALQTGVTSITVTSANQKTASCMVIITDPFSTPAPTTTDTPTPAPTPTPTPTDDSTPIPQISTTPAPTSLPSPTVSSPTPTTLGPKLSVPKAPTITKHSSNTARITWKINKNAVGYTIYRSTKKTSGYQPIATLKKVGTTTYLDKQLRSNKRYYYKIKALSSNSESTSDLSKPTYFIICKPVVQLTSKKQTENRYTIKWSKNKHADGYILYYSNKKSTGFRKYGATTKNSFLLRKNAKYIKVSPYIKSNGSMIIGISKTLRIK